MKKSGLFILLLALLLFAGGALAADGAVENPAPDPDAQLRTALRLSDLGYLTSPVIPAANGALDEALNAFYAQNGLSGAEAAPEQLFRRDVRPAGFPGSGAALPDAPLCTGVAADRNSVFARLLPGETYAVTDCGTGVVCSLTCEALDGYACMRPGRDWDASTLSGLMGADSGFAKRPVVLALGGESIAACLEPVEGGDPLRYGLFFSGGLAGLNGIEDADRAAMLAYAAGTR